MMRLYQNAPKWAALNRSEETEANQYRKEYLLARSKWRATGPEVSASTCLSSTQEIGQLSH